MPDFSADKFYKDEFNRLQEKQKNATAIVNSQERLAELNDSYRKRYAKYVQIVMVLVLAIGIYLAAVLLQIKFPAIPQVAVDIVSIVLIFLVTFYLFSAFSELYSRSILNYDEIDMPAYDSSGVDVHALQNKGQIFGGQANSVCVGEACCTNGGLKYDSTNDKCVSGFTTRLDYEKLESAYTSVPFNSNVLKREPTANVKPVLDGSVLSFSSA